MNFKLHELSDPELLERTEHVASEERRVTCALIEHLREVQRRKLYADVGCASLFQYCIRVLKMSEPSAQRRLDALRLTEAMPEAIEKIENGSLTLSSAAQLQTFIRREEKAVAVTHEKKQELLKAIEGQSYRDAERELLKRSSAPEVHCIERAIPIGDTQMQIQFIATQEQMVLFEQARAKLAHVDPRMSWAELFTQLARRFLKEPKRRSVSPTVGGRRHAGAALRREVLDRDGRMCVNCGSRWALEVDHIKPWALGGATTKENLRTLCRNCNQRAAFRQFGA